MRLAYIYASGCVQLMTKGGNATKGLIDSFRGFVHQHSGSWGRAQQDFRERVAAAEGLQLKTWSDYDFTVSLAPEKGGRCAELRRSK